MDKITVILYASFKNTLMAYDDQLAKEAKKLAALTKGYKSPNGFIPKSVLDGIQGFREQEHAYNTVADARKRFLVAVPLKVRKKYLRQMAKERRVWDLERQ